MQQQPANEEESPIWAIDLFERRQFRNGNAEAQCLECGERFHTTEVNTMTGHIVQDHPQYAAKLLAKQLEFGGHQRMLKEEESPIEPCSTSTTMLAAERQQQAILADVNAGAKQMSPTLSLSMATMPKDGLSSDRTSAIALSPFRPLSPATPEATTNQQAAAGNCIGAAARFAFAADDAIGMAPISMVKGEEQREGGQTVHHHDETDSRQFDMEMRDVSVTTNDTFSSTTTTGKTTSGGGGDNKVHYVDRFGKEWRLFVSAVDPELLDKFVRQNMLCRSGPPKHDGRIYYSCRWSGRWSPYQNCLHRALYLPGRKALVYRRTHNHPIPISALNANNSGILTVPMAAAQQQQENNGSNNDDNVSAFSAALPDIDNSENATTDSKEHVVEAVAVAAISDNRPPPHIDPFGKQWDWLLDLHDVGDKEKIRQFCHTHFLTRCSTYPRRISYVCKVNKRHTLRGCVRCPYRALYVAERGAVFAYKSHNHAPIEDKKCVGGANGTLNSSGISDSFDLRRDANSSNSTATKNDSQSSFVSNKSIRHNIKTKQHIDNNNNKTAQSEDTYVGGTGRVWTRLATLDEADGDCTAARQQLRVLCELHKLRRYNLRRNLDGTFHTVGLACSEWRKFHCPYRAIYLVKLRAVFHWSSHDHTTKKPKPTPKSKPKKILTNKKSGGKKMTIKRTKKKAIKRAKNKVVKIKGEPRQHIVGTSTSASTDANQYLSISKFALSDHKAPVIMDHLKNLWHWLADLADDSDGVVFDFCRQYYVNKQSTTVDEKRTIYWCRYRKAPISCPYKLMHFRAKNTLYHRLSHNHSMPLSNEEMKRFRQKRREERRPKTTATTNVVGPTANTKEEAQAVDCSSNAGTTMKDKADDN